MGKRIIYCFLLATDEGALVRAAREVGVVFKIRTPKSVIIEVVSVLYSSVTKCRSFKGPVPFSAKF